MTTNRPYRPSITQDDALAELCRGAGVQFDPDVVAAFCGEAELAARYGWGGLRAAGAA
jgi:HD-GYP domain-containing protein (c-di-GMP phosphodiesterase class II)